MRPHDRDSRKQAAKAAKPYRLGVALLLVPLLIASLAPTAAAGPLVRGEGLQPGIPLDGTACAEPSGYQAQDVEYHETFNDEGTGNFWMAAAPWAFPLGYFGDGGHTGEVWMCKTSTCAGGWMPVVSDFTWAGTSLLGYGASIAIHSYEKKQPVVYTTCGGLLADYAVAVAQAQTVEGTYAAHALHGGLVVQSSSGEAQLRADADVSGAAGYSYHWTFAGRGSLGPVGQLVCDLIQPHCNQIHDPGLLTVYGVGSDQDVVS